MSYLDEAQVEIVIVNYFGEIGDIILNSRPPKSRPSPELRRLYCRFPFRSFRVIPASLKNL
jgi:hypothetical protein